MQAAPRSSRSLRLRSLRTLSEFTPFLDDHFLRKSRIALGGTCGFACSSVSRMLSGESSRLSVGVAGPCRGSDRVPGELMGSGRAHGIWSGIEP